MRRNTTQSGVVLLLTLMVLAILIVVVGQFSATAVLDWKIMRNREREVQLTLDARSGLEAVLQGLAERDDGDGGGFALSLDREDSDVEASVEDESGKFSLNALKKPPKGISSSKAEEVFRRLIDLADDPPGVLPPGCADAILAFMSAKERPAPTLAGLLSVEGITKEVLWGSGDGGSGLAQLVTVHGDGRIRPGAGDDRVMLALSEKLTPAILEQALEFIRNPTPNPPPQVAELAQDVLPWTTWTSQAFTAEIRVRRGAGQKRLRAAIEAKDKDFRVILCDELD
jgi:hypothetical protein